MPKPADSRCRARALLVLLAGTACVHGAPNAGSWNSLNESTAVTTNIRDAPPEVHWLQEYTPEVPPPRPITSLNGQLLPGYYALTVQSYCLHAGTYAPTAGDGYLIATLAGARSAQISRILKRSVDYPQVPQHDIQRLIWGIEAGAGFDEYDPAFIARVQPLLSEEELAAVAMNTGLRHAWNVAQGLLPSPLRDAASVYGQLRSMVTSATTTFEQVERVAVLVGAAPPGPGSRDVAAGAWSYIGNGLYMRAFPQGYPTTTVEIVRPAPYALVRDGKGRVLSFQSGPFRVDTTYDDSPRPHLVRSGGGPALPVWLLKSIHLRGPEPADDMTLTGTGWVIPADQANETLGPGGMPPPAAPGVPLLRGPSFEEVQDAYARARRVRDAVRLVEDQRRASNQEVNQQALADAIDLDHYMRGLFSAVVRVPPQPRGEWLKDHPVRVKNAWAFAVCVLAGECVLPGATVAGGPDAAVEVDLWTHVAVPGNTSRQRLGLSWRRR